MHLAGIALMLMTASAAAQQTTATTEPSEKPALEEIVVSASRIRQSGFTAPTPTTVIGPDALDNRAAVNIADLLNELPAITGSVTPETTNISTTSVGGNFLNLRDLGTVRTLVLVDGRRHVPTLPFSNAVDVNVIPTPLVERVEVVTGGASAAWGSDAVAGVVNFIVDDDLDGIKVEAQAGRSDRGDNDTYKLSLGAGQALFGGRGHIVVGLEKTEEEGILQQDSRGWAQEWGTISNPAYSPGNGEYRLVPVPDAHLGIAAEGGLIVDGPLAGTQFAPGGIPVPFQYGDLRTGTTMSGGDGLNFGSDVSLRVPVDRWSAFSTIRFDVTEDLEAFFQPSFSRSRSVNELVQTYSLGATTILQDNAFLPDTLRDRMIDLGIESFRLGRVDNDAPFITVDVETETYRLIGGLRGSVGEWQWEASAQYGESSYLNLIRNNRIAANYALAVDAVLDPNTGRVVCRSTLTTPDNGCVPMNLFGSGSLTPEAIDYTTADQRLDTTFKQQTVEVMPWDGMHWGNAWISFESVPRENALEIVRGSHRGTRYDGTTFRDPDDPTEPLHGYDQLPRLPDVEALRKQDPNAFDIVSWATEPCDVVLVHPASLHGGAPVDANCPDRHTLVLRFFGDDAVFRALPSKSRGGYTPAGALHLEHISHLRDGEPYRSPFYVQVA